MDLGKGLGIYCVVSLEGVVGELGVGCPELSDVFWGWFWIDVGV